MKKKFKYLSTARLTFYKYFHSLKLSVSVGKEQEIPLRQTQKFCPENCFCCGSTKNDYTEKSLFARHGPFSQVLSHNMLSDFELLFNSVIHNHWGVSEAPKIMDNAPLFFSPCFCLST